MIKSQNSSQYGQNRGPVQNASQVTKHFHMCILFDFPNPGGQTALFLILISAKEAMIQND